MANRELGKLFVVLTLIAGMTVSFSACSKGGGPTGGGAGMQQQQQPSERGMKKQSPMATKKQSPTSAQKRTSEPGKSQQKKAY